MNWICWTETKVAQSWRQV